MKIVADDHIPYLDHYFSVYGEIVRYPGRSITRENLHDAELLLVRSITPVNADLLADTSVRFVGSVTAGIDHLDTAWLNEKGIAWAAVKGFNAPPVADYVASVVALLTQQGKFDLNSARAVVIGVGCVGSLVASHLTALGIEVQCCDPFRESESSSYRWIDLDEIADVDLISVHVPLTVIGEHPTYHFLNHAFFDRQRSGCVLINASRGSVLDTNAWLRYGQHLLTVLDVFEDEPKIKKDVLNHAWLTTPHIAGYSVQSKMRGVEWIYEAAVSCAVIAAQPIQPSRMPVTVLSDESVQDWQSVVLQVFNPLELTAQMQAMPMIEGVTAGSAFDAMRNTFRDRMEFSCVEIPIQVMNRLSVIDQAYLQSLGFRVKRV